MRIDPGLSSQANYEVERARPKAVRNQQGSTPAGPAFSSDVVELSSLAGQALGGPEVRNDKVNVLRAEVQSGTYQVSDSQLADAILRDVIQR